MSCVVVPLVSALANTIKFSEAWTHATVSNASFASVFVTINSEAPMVITGAISPIAEAVEISDTRIEDGVIRHYTMPDGIKVPKGRTILNTAGPQFLLLGLKKQLRYGTKFPLIIKLGNGTNWLISVSIKPLGYVTPK